MSLSPNRGRLKIAFISQYFHPEQFLNNTVATSLVKSGHDVQVFCSVPNYGQSTFFPGYSNRTRRAERWNGIQIERVFTVARGKSPAQLALNYMIYPFACVWSFFWRRKWTPDVSFVSMPSPVFQAIAGLILNKIWGVPAVHWVQDLWPDTAEVVLSIKSPILRGVLKHISGYLYRNATLVLVQSQAFQQRLVELGVKPDRIRFLPNTAPPLFQPIKKQDATTTARYFKKNTFNLVFAGNIGEAQDFPTILTAISLVNDLSNYNFVVIGSGRGLEEAKRIVEEKNLINFVNFIGRHEEAQMPLFFAHADALLVSLKDNPIFAMTIPYKVHCYLACGKPILASLSGEGARILKESNAACVSPSGKPDVLAKQLMLLASKSLKERSAMGRAGRAYFERNFAPDVVFKTLENALEFAARKTYTR